MLTFTHQITSLQKKTINALKESEEQFRSLFELSRDAFGIADISGQLVDSNQALLDMLGYSLDEIKELTLGDITPKKWRERDFDVINNQIMRFGYSKIYEKELIRKDGKIIPIEVRGVLIKDETEKPKQIFAIIRETSERKQLERKLRRKEKLVVLGQLAGGVGHELRNPLGAIKNAAFFLNMTLEESECEPEVKESLKIIEQEVTTSELIIKSLLDYMRPKPLRLGKINLNDIIQRVESYISIPKNIIIVKNLDNDSIEILADPDQIAQVFHNIINNAVQAMPEGGQLTISTRVEEPKWIKISFTDTGVGISKQNFEKIFEPLFTTKAKGIGFGLAISKVLIEGHGGNLEFVSEVGGGSTFTIKLPINRKEEQ